MRRVLVLALLAGLLLMTIPGVSTAANGPTSTAGVTATVAWAGVGCSDLTFWPDDALQGWTEFKIKKPVTGTYAIDETDSIDITVTGSQLDWSYSELYAVIVKGSNLAYVYNYSLASEGNGTYDVTSDTGLTVPINSKGIKSVTFCFEAAEA